MLIAGIGWQIGKSANLCIVDESSGRKPAYLFVAFRKQSLRVA
jgi:hypothetical protein